MKLNVRGFALAAGTLWGLVLFVITLLAVWRRSGQHLRLLSGFYWGYQVSYPGTLIGFAYGLVNGLLVGALFAWLYNRMATEG